MSDVTQGSQANNGALFRQDIPKFEDHFPGDKIEGQTFGQGESYTPMKKTSDPDILLGEFHHLRRNNNATRNFFRK